MQGLHYSIVPALSVITTRSAACSMALYSVRTVSSFIQRPVHRDLRPDASLFRKVASFMLADGGSPRFSLFRDILHPCPSLPGELIKALHLQDRATSRAAARGHPAQYE